MNEFRSHSILVTCPCSLALTSIWTSLIYFKFCVFSIIFVDEMHVMRCTHLSAHVYISVGNFEFKFFWLNPSSRMHSFIVLECFIRCILISAGRPGSPLFGLIARRSSIVESSIQ